MAYQIDSKMNNYWYKEPTASKYFLIDAEWGDQWKKYLQGEIKDSPHNYVSDDKINERFNQGEILTHRVDFYLIPDNEKWRKFNKYFV